MSGTNSQPIMPGVKIKYKIATLFTVLTGAILCVLSIFIYLFTSMHRKDEFFTRLNTRAGVAAEYRFLQSEVDARLAEEISHKHLQTLPEEHEWILNADTRKDAITSLLDSLDIPAHFLSDALQNGYAKHASNRIQTVGIRYPFKGSTYLVMVSAFDETGQDFMTYLFRVLLTGLVASVAIVFGLGLFYAGSILYPITAIIHKINNITASNLHMRLQVKETQDELSELAITFNRMLDRLETSFDIQHNFISNASHELNNPLTAILGETEIALSKERPPGEYVQSLQTIAREAMRLERITINLLKLAQTSYNDKGLIIERFRLDELLLEIKKNVNETNPDNQVKLSFDERVDEQDLYLTGSLSLVKIALTNIIENASKFSGNRRVDVRLFTESGNLVVHVRDRGVGIPEKELKYIYDPFFRASNVRSIKGFGIGLPLAYKIMSLHHGKIRVHSEENKGTTFELVFPLGKTPDIK